VSHPPQDAPSAELLIRVNGEERTVAAGASVADLVLALGLGGRRLAVAVNREVVPRASHALHRLAAGDRVEILEAVGGG
jgi:thiamine biosynthesis protein ThiS